MGGMPPVPIVGVDASASGLDAFRILLQHLPPDTGIAFVLVQHLDPHRESMPVELLGRQTGMPVSEASDIECLVEATEHEAPQTNG